MFNWSVPKVDCSQETIGILYDRVAQQQRKTLRSIHSLRLIPDRYLIPVTATTGFSSAKDYIFGLACIRREITGQAVGVYLLVNWKGTPHEPAYQERMDKVTAKMQELEQPWPYTRELFDKDGYDPGQTVVQILDHWSGDRTLIGHNLKFDLGFLQALLADRVSSLTDNHGTLDVGHLCAAAFHGLEILPVEDLGTYLEDASKRRGFSWALKECDTVYQLGDRLQITEQIETNFARLPFLRKAATVYSLVETIRHLSHYAAEA